MKALLESCKGSVVLILRAVSKQMLIYIFNKPRLDSEESRPYVKRHCPRYGVGQRNGKAAGQR